MYEDISGKIKGLAKFIGWTLLICGVIAFIYFITDTKFGYAITSNDGLAWAALISGICGYVGSWALYGFGELIEHAEAIRQHLSNIEAKTSKQPQYQPPKRPLDTDSAPHMADN